MKLAAGIRLDANGIAQSINAMQMQMDIMGMYSENLVGFDKVGYQKKIPVVSSFAEYIGSNALSHSIDDQVGRLSITENPLDVALSDKGYFQVLNEDGSVELTRDGRFMLNKEGELLSLKNQKVLSTTGYPITFPILPEALEEIKIGIDGKIGVFDKEKREFAPVATLGVVSTDGTLIDKNCVRQGYVESSNVEIAKEAMEISNHMRTFEANVQLFKIQNAKLSTAIQRLGQV